MRHVLQLQLGGVDEGREQPGLPARGRERVEHRALQDGEIVGREVRKVGVRRVAPDRFHGIELGRVGGQPFHHDPRVLAQPGRHAGGAVRPMPIPDEGEPVGPVTVEGLEESEDLGAPDVVAVEGPGETEPPPTRRHRERADGRQAVPAVPLPEDGVWPRGAQVRRQTGCSMKPLSSRKTRLRPARRAFFYMRPALRAPAPDGRLVPFPGPALGLLTAPSFAAEDLPHVRGMIPDPEGTGDDLRHAGQGPEVGAEPVRGRAFHQEREQLGPLLRRDPRRPPGRRLGAQPVGAAGPDLGPPAADGHRRAVDLPGDLAHPEPFVEEGDGPAPPRFERCGAARWSHASKGTTVPFIMQGSIGWYEWSAHDARTGGASYRSVT